MPENMISLPKGTKSPNHIAIIPDGNRRWARSRGLNTFQGHKKGFERAVELARVARRLGIHTVTLWGFSTENWDRSEKEVNYLMKLYERLIDDYLKEAREEEVRIFHIGRKNRLPGSLVKKIRQAEEETSIFTKYVLNIALDYGGHDELIRAITQLIEDKIPVKKINKQKIEKYLDTKDQPYPYVDLLIRTSGEQRTSGLLLWQMEYAEMYWETEHFPDFTPERFRAAILDYSRRRRRFGGNDATEHLSFKPQLTAQFELAWWRLSKIPEGTKFSDYALKHFKEQFGLSSKLASKAAQYMFLAVKNGNKKEWVLATKNMKRFYSLLKDELKLAFEPSIVAHLEIKLWQKMGEREVHPAEFEEISRNLVAEVYRLSDFQAAKAAHLRALATMERGLAEENNDNVHWQKAENYLELYYKALKDRVA